MYPEQQWAELAQSPATPLLLYATDNNCLDTALPPCHIATAVSCGLHLEQVGMEPGEWEGFAAAVRTAATRGHPLEAAFDKYVKWLDKHEPFQVSPRLGPVGCPIARDHQEIEGVRAVGCAGLVSAPCRLGPLA
jgi:hypothetical protein